MSICQYKGETELILKWIRSNLLANGVSVERLSIGSAYELVKVLAATGRAMSYDEFYSADTDEGERGAATGAAVAPVIPQPHLSPYLTDQKVGARRGNKQRIRSKAVSAEQLRALARW